ncbi:MAG: substrate-binding domain-containing protein [Gammaproteobacteria bacterium]|nr:substrate-binding domain-containing protein [Gammaproteobacteria bacterium]
MRSIVQAAAGVLLGLAVLGAQAGNDENRIVRMATTTSTENSGLLRVLLPEFQKVSGYEVQVIAVGTGKALRMGREGDVDLVLVHAPAAEKKFVDGGFGVDRKGVMYNDFVIVGPHSDPAGASSGSDATAALQRIARSGALFLSRGDDSGTHKKELGLWSKAGITPKGDWYREAGQGMGKVLQMSGELDAYTLTDRGTWLAYMAKSPLKIVSEGDPRLFNPYSIIPVNPQRHPHVNYTGATALSEWITSPAGQTLIGSYTINEKHLFTPSANTHEVATK